MSSAEAGFDNALSALVWRRKYRFVPEAPSTAESTIFDSWRRVAAAVASVERESSGWRDRFLDLLTDFRFLPGGRILASAGTGLDATLFNCFVMGNIEDSNASILERLRESERTMQLGGGIGCDFSTVRTHEKTPIASDRSASGPISLLHLWDSMC